MDDRSIDKLKPQIEAEEVASHTREEVEAPPTGQAPVKEGEEQKLHDEIDSLYYGDGFSEYSKGSKRS